MGSVTKVLLASDILLFRYHYLGKRSGHFVGSSVKKSQRLLRELDTNRDLQAAVAQITIDYVFSIIEREDSSEAAQQFIEELRDKGGSSG